MSALFALKVTVVPIFILALNLAGRRWGTAVSGWLAATVLAVFTHRYQGGPSANRLLRGLVAGLWTMGVFFLAVAGTIGRLGVGPSFALAAAADLVSHGGSLLVLRTIRSM